MQSNNPLFYGHVLVKQLPTATAVVSVHGEFELDDELRTALIIALRPILERRAAAAQAHQFDQVEFDLVQMALVR